MESSLSTAAVLQSLKKRENEVLNLMKIKEKYESEFQTLRESLIEKEYRLKRVSEDNAKLKEKLKQLYVVCGGNNAVDLPEELKKAKEESRKLREKLRQTVTEYEEKLEEARADISKRVLEVESRYEALYKLNDSDKHANNELLEENRELDAKLNESLMKIQMLEREIHGFTEEISIVKQENILLTEENAVLEKKTAPPDYIRLKSEIDSAYKQASEIFTAIHCIKTRTDLTTILTSSSQPPESDIFKVLSSLKSTLSKTKLLIIEFNTETSQESLCNPQ